jgi:hypothetical protein
MFKRKWLTAGLALLVGGGLAAATPALAAVGTTSPPGSPDILLGAQLLSKGAAALVSFQYVCQPGDFPNTQVTLTQKSGNGIASGTTFLTPAISCDGLTHTAQVDIVAGPSIFGPSGSKPFGSGAAYGQLFFNSLLSGLSYDARNLTLKK